VALVTACSLAACGPTYPPPRIRTPAPSTASPPTPNDPAGVTDPDEETDETGSGDVADESEATDATDTADESEPPSPPAPPPAPAQAPALLTNVTGVVRYRLLIHDNPVDPAQAFRCYSGCRQAPTEAIYLECLRQCPGFEAEAGVTCGPEEGIPNSVCLVHRVPSPQREPTPGVVVAAILLNFVVLFGLASICNASASQCGFGYRSWPYSRY
jgi:hypothetical protein